MKNKEKKRSRRAYRSVVLLARLAAPLLHVMYYACIVLVVFFAITALIVFLVNTSVEKMLLPPLMTLHEDGYYSIAIGNGIRIDAVYEAVTLGDIKTVIYAELLLAAAVCCMLAPISLFLSRLMKSIAAEKPLLLQNARYVLYIGLSVMLGYTFVQVASSFYNYLLVKTFVEDGSVIHLAMGLNLGGAAAGLLIMLLGYVYGYACETTLMEESTPELHHELSKR